MKNWLLIAILTIPLSANDVLAGEASASLTLPGNARYVIGNKGPAPCSGNSTADADAILRSVGGAIDDAVVGGPLLSIATANPKIADNLRRMFGMKGGEGQCGTLCVVIPADAKWKSYLCWGPPGQDSTCGFYGHIQQVYGWASGDPPTTANAGNKMIVCEQVRNWKVGRPTAFTLVVSY